MLDAVDSTNAEARRRAKAAEVGPTWISAHRQHQGHGRRGRAWLSSDDDLKATLLLRPALARPETTLAEIGTLSFVAGLAVADLVEAVAPDADVRLKWPNDVLVSGRKIAGVLLESEAPNGMGLSDRAAVWVAIGIGLNIVSAPPPEAVEAQATPTIALSDLAPGVGRDAALNGLASAMATRLASWAAGGFGGVREAWLAKAARLGEPIVARLPRETVSGRFVDVDGDGALVLTTDQGTRRIAAADVFFP